MTEDRMSRHPEKDTLFAYVLGDLDETERDAFEAHAAVCEVCRRTVERLTGALDGYERRPHPEAPAGVLVDLLNRQAASARPGPGWTRLLTRWPVPVMTAVFLVGFFATGFWAGRRTSVSPATRASVEADSLRVRLPLPDPPPVSFHTAMTESF